MTMIAEQLTLGTMSRMQRIALIKARHKKLILEARDESDADFMDVFADGEVAGVADADADEDLIYETN